MANEILILDQSRTGRRRNGRQIQALFFHLLSPPITVPGGGATIVPTPAVDLPKIVSDLALLNQTELDALDAGSAVFEETELFLTEEESTDQLRALAKLRGQYARSDFVASLRQRYRFMGRRIDA
jgi:hypothetical protein